MVGKWKPKVIRQNSPEADPRIAMMRLFPLNCKLTGSLSKEGKSLTMKVDCKTSML